MSSSLSDAGEDGASGGSNWARQRTMLAENGFFSEANVKACAAGWRLSGLSPCKPGKPSPVLERTLCGGAARAGKSTPVEAMAHRLKTPEGKKLYALRKCMPEPVFGIIKSVLRFRQFLLRGTGQRARRVEPCDHGLEYQADVRLEGRLRWRFSLMGPLSLRSRLGCEGWKHRPKPSACSIEARLPRHKKRRYQLLLPVRQAASGVL